MTYQLHHGDCINIMPLIERESIDAVICDPPYGLGFMGKDWDHGVPGMHFWLEALRCAKPGAYLLAFGGTRTFHRLAVAIEDAGWEIRDCIQWLYGSGFPKSHDVSKAIDREAGAEREVIGKRKAPGMAKTNVMQGAQNRSVYEFDELSNNPATPAAAEWDGWGTALKPAWEPIIVARKPLQGTVAENVQRYGTGAMNIDACRIETEPRNPGYANRLARQNNVFGEDKRTRPLRDEYDTSQGRWPANVIHDGSAEVLAGFPMTSSGGKSGLKMDRWTANGRRRSNPTTEQSDYAPIVSQVWLLSPPGIPAAKARSVAMSGPNSFATSLTVIFPSRNKAITRSCHVSTMCLSL